MDTLTTENQVTRMIEKFGGMSKLSRALGHKNPTTVQSWKANGFIPTAWQQPVYDACVDNGIKVSIDDFIAIEQLQNTPQQAGSQAE